MSKKFLFCYLLFIPQLFLGQCDALVRQINDSINRIEKDIETQQFIEAFKNSQRFLHLVEAECSEENLVSLKLKLLGAEALILNLEDIDSVSFVGQTETYLAEINEYINEHSNNDTIKSDLLNLEGLLMFVKQDFVEAKVKHLEAYEIRKRLFKEPNYKSARSLHYLGNCIYMLNYRGDDAVIQRSTDTLLLALRDQQKSLSYNHPEIILSHSILALNYGDLNNTIEQDWHSKKVEDLNYARGRNDLALYERYFNAEALFKRGDYKNSQLELQKLEIECSQERNDFVLARVYHGLMKINQVFGNYGESKKLFQKSSLLFEKVDNGSLDHINVYNDYAISLGELGLYDESSKNFKKYLMFLSKSKYKNPSNHSIGYLNLGNQYRKLGDLKKALLYHQKALNIRGQGGSTMQDLITAYVALGETYFEMDKVKEGLKEFDKAEALLIKRNDQIGLANCLTLKAKCELSLKKYDRSIDQLNESIEINKEYYGVNNRFNAENYFLLGKIQREKNDYEEAVDYLNKALGLTKSSGGVSLQTLRIELELAEVRFNEGKNKELKHHLNNCQRIIEATSFLNHSMVASYYNLKIKACNKLNSSCNSLELCKSAIEKLKEVSNNYSEADSEIQNRKELFYYYELAITNLLKNKDDNYILEAFSLAEMSKSELLLRQLRMSNNVDEDGVPDSLMIEESRLKKQITDYVKPISKLDEKIMSEDDYFKVKKKYFDLVEYLESNYNDYYNLKYKRKATPVADIQQRLGANESLIQYFWGERLKCVFVVNKDSVYVDLLNESVNNSILEEYRYAIMNKNGSKVDELGKFIYSSIIAPCEKKLRNRLYIIPDNYLALLPFDALKHSEGFMIEKYNISYLSSPNSFLMNKKEGLKKLKTIAFAPEFLNSMALNTIEINDSILNFGNLNYNIPEAKNVIDIANGRILLYPETSISVFSEALKDYNVIHIATHAFSDNADGDLSCIVFRDSVGLEVLSGYEIYNLETNAEMIVLSACQTAMGEIAVGEGIIGLTRGFEYSGANSVISSLWAVNDVKGSEIIQLFYKNLVEEGMDKSDALRSAKLNFINNSLTPDPIYWASFTAFGDMSPLVAESNNSYWLLIFGLILVLVAFFISRNKRRIRN